MADESAEAEGFASTVAVLVITSDCGTSPTESTNVIVCVTTSCDTDDVTLTDPYDKADSASAMLEAGASNAMLGVVSVEPGPKNMVKEP
eukprot:389040_1